MEETQDYTWINILLMLSFIGVLALLIIVSTERDEYKEKLERCQDYSILK